MSTPRHPLVIALFLTLTVAATGPAAAVVGHATVDTEFASQLAEADAAADTDAFVHFSREVAYADGVAAVRNAGLAVNIDLPAAHAVYAFGPVEGFEALRLAPEVVFLEDAGVEPIHLETATWATRARTLYEQTGGLDLRVNAPNGDPLDGRGVGIAIVDTGVDASHQDLKWAGLGGADIKTVRNFKVVCPSATSAGCSVPPVLVDVVDSDTTSGHGTHVAGISAGNGIVGDANRNWRGVAPESKIFGFGTGEGISIVTAFAAASFQWIIDNGHLQNPPIKVVNNSWGGAGNHNPTEVVSQLSNAMLNKGITVVFAAGNDGGTGTTVATNRHANNPTPGVISVANYNDQERGTRNGTLSGTSSRGLSTNPATWPDVSAPGSFIQSACKVGSVTCTPVFGSENIYVENKGYVRVSGTSMAAPHTAGVVALVHQANLNLTPAQVEKLLEDTAHKFTFGAPYTADPANPDNTSSFDKGHGLVDARLAVLRTLGLPDEFGLQGGAGAPSIDITTPADGATVGRTFQVAGTANTGAGPVSNVIASGDGGDVPVAAADLTMVTLEERINGTVAVTWEVTNASTPPSTGVEFALFNSIDGVARRLGMTWNGTTATCVQALASNCAASRSGNSLTAIYQATGANSLGAVRGAIMFDAWAATFTDNPETPHDRAPGDVGATSTTHPALGQEHVFAAPSNPVGAVNVYVDGNPVAGNPVATGQGAFNWQTTVGPLPCGTHMILAEIELDTNPVLSASDSITVRVLRRTSRPTSIPC